MTPIAWDTNIQDSEGICSVPCSLAAERSHNLLENAFMFLYTHVSRSLQHTVFHCRTKSSNIYPSISIYFIKVSKGIIYFHSIFLFFFDNPNKHFQESAILAVQGYLATMSS